MAADPKFCFNFYGPKIDREGNKALKTTGSKINPVVCFITLAHLLVNWSIRTQDEDLALIGKFQFGTLH